MAVLFEVVHPIKLLIYSRYRQTDWWRCLASQLAMANATVVASEFRNDGDVDVMRAFYHWMSQPGIASLAVATFGEAACEEIRLRCRYLRTVDRVYALQMIGAMVRTQSGIIDEVLPDAVLSLCIDYYAVDILERILAERGIRFVGLSAAAIAGQTLVSTRGEHNHLREPDDEEVKRAYDEVTSSTFAPFLPVAPQYGTYAFAKKYAYYTARAAAFRAIRLIKRDPLNFHYSLGQPGLGWRMRLRDRQVRSHFDSDWEQVAEGFPLEKRLFVALGVYPESTIDYWVHSPSLLDYAATLHDVVTAFSNAGYLVLVKDHPNMFGFQRKELIEQLHRIDHVVFAPYESPSRAILSMTACTFTLAGTVGMQAALAGRTSIVTDPYYFVDRAFVRLGSRADIASLPQRVQEFVPSSESDRQEIVRQVLRTCIPADLLQCWQEFSPRSPTGGPHTTELAASIDRYLPALLGTTG